MGRQYKIEGVGYPSVTTVRVLDKSAALMPWAVRLAVQYCEEHKEDPEVFEKAKKEWRSVSQEALDIGSSVHDAIECYLKHGKDKTKEEIYSKADLSDEQKEQIDNAFLAWLDWYGENISECIESEMTVVEKTHCYGGTLDFIGKLKDGRTVLIDWKSSKGFYEGYNWQLYAYRAAVEEMRPDLKIDTQMVVRLDKLTGLPEAKEYTDYERGREVFLSLLDFYYKAKKRRLTNNPKVKEVWA